MTENEKQPGWIRMRFKRNKVWMAVDSQEQPLTQKGKVLVKYQLDQPHQYWVRQDNVTPLDEKQVAQPSADARKRPLSNPQKARPRPGNPAGESPEALADSNKAICIYTDGACSGNPGPAGIGIVMHYQGHRKEISRYIGMATNNIAELEAIRVGLASVTNRNLPIILFSDSSYSLGLLTQGWKAKQNQELVQKVRTLASRFKNLRFVKIKGHAGHPDNERADQLAVEAIKTGAA